MATTHNATGGVEFVVMAPSWGVSGHGFGQNVVMKFHVDMDYVAHDLLGATVDGSASDVVQLWDIPAYDTYDADSQPYYGTQIHGVVVVCTTAEGAAATVAVGDGSATAGYMAAMSINAAGASGTITTDTYAAATKVYSATDTLDLLFGTAADIDAAVFDVYVNCTFFGHG